MADVPIFDDVPMVRDDDEPNICDEDVTSICCPKAICGREIESPSGKKLVFIAFHACIRGYDSFYPGGINPDPASVGTTARGKTELIFWSEALAEHQIEHFPNEHFSTEFPNNEYTGYVRYLWIQQQVSTVSLPSFDNINLRILPTWELTNLGTPNLVSRSFDYIDPNPDKAFFDPISGITFPNEYHDRPVIAWEKFGYNDDFTWSGNYVIPSNYDANIIRAQGITQEELDVLTSEGMNPSGATVMVVPATTIPYSPPTIGEHPYNNVFFERPITPNEEGEITSWNGDPPSLDSHDTFSTRLHRNEALSFLFVSESTNVVHETINPDLIPNFVLRSTCITLPASVAFNLSGTMLDQIYFAYGEKQGLPIGFSTSCLGGVGYPTGGPGIVESLSITVAGTTNEETPDSDVDIFPNFPYHGPDSDGAPGVSTRLLEEGGIETKDNLWIKRQAQASGYLGSLNSSTILTAVDHDGFKGEFLGYAQGRSVFTTLEIRPITTYTVGQYLQYLDGVGQWQGQGSGDPDRFALEYNYKASIIISIGPDATDAADTNGYLTIWDHAFAYNLKPNPLFGNARIIKGSDYPNVFTQLKVPPESATQPVILNVNIFPEDWNWLGDSVKTLFASNAYVRLTAGALDNHVVFRIEDYLIKQNPFPDPNPNDEFPWRPFSWESKSVKGTRENGSISFG